MQGIIVVGCPFMKPATTDIQVCETVKSIRPINVINNYFSDFLGKKELCFSTYSKIPKISPSMYKPVQI